MRIRMRAEEDESLLSLYSILRKCARVCVGVLLAESGKQIKSATKLPGCGLVDGDGSGARSQSSRRTAR